MQNSTIKLDTILLNLKEKLTGNLENLVKKLEEGDFKDFETELKEVTDDFYNDLAETIINEVAESLVMEEKAKSIGKRLNLTVRKTQVSITLCTGKEIKIRSYYGSRVIKKKKRGRNKKRGPNGSGRHLLIDYWGFIGKASPMTYSLLTLFTVICPSYEVCKLVLSELGICMDCKKIRRIALSVGKKSHINLEHRVTLVLNPEDRATGKRLILSVDGGRTRTRRNKSEPPKADLGAEEKKYKKHKKFDTPWKEPKLLVIQEIDEDGQIKKKSLPIYDAVMGNAATLFKLLKTYLKKITITEVQQVLFIGDGARWIWTRAKKLFKELGLQDHQYVLAIDYYHASQQLYKIIEQIPTKNFSMFEKLLKPTKLSEDTDNEEFTIKAKNKKELFTELKEYLWTGKIDQLASLIKKIGKGKLPKINGLLGYFTKRKELFNYKNLRDLKLPCGSGIVESAIRRVINLRFKAPSSFWIPKNVEQLIFFRGVALAGRWNIFINNLAKSVL